KYPSTPAQTIVNRVPNPPGAKFTKSLEKSLNALDNKVSAHKLIDFGASSLGLGAGLIGGSEGGYLSTAAGLYDYLRQAAVRKFLENPARIKWLTRQFANNPTLMRA